VAPTHQQPPAGQSLSVAGLRFDSQNNADPSKPLHQEVSTAQALRVVRRAGIYDLPFVHHLADGLALLTIWHPDEEVKASGLDCTTTTSPQRNFSHFLPENLVFIQRHRGQVEHK